MSDVQVASGPLSGTVFIRILGWANLAVMFAFLANTCLTFIAGLPGASLSGSPVGLLQAALYPIFVGVAVWAVLRTSDRTLRQDSERVSDMNATLIRCAFWAVVLLGVVDAAISFMRVEGMLEGVFGEDLAGDLGRSRFRGLYVHLPLIAVGILIGLRVKDLGFHWLALLIVIAELLIVICRFIFSYEQAFMADLIRFWYGALFLFASAHTLLEEGHVRVDIIYASLKTRAKGRVNAIGSILLGMTLCWMILYLGMAQKSSVIVSPVLNFETTQSGFGLYLKYMMAAFLGIFAVSMKIQFVSYLLAAVADYRGDPGRIEPESAGAH
ncbi:MAG: TRAP transporter small permease subunit [Pseudomonadota bacterium]